MFLFYSSKSGMFRFFFVLIFVLVVFSFLVSGMSSLFLSKKYFDYNDGVDVVILSASNGAFGFGHLALLFNSSDEWFYFSWQSSKVVFSMVPDEVLVNFESFNEWVLAEGELQSYIHAFDSAILVSGDFTDSLVFAENLFINYLENQGLSDECLLGFDASFLGRNSDYDVFFNNCVDVSYEVLSKGFIGDVSFGDIVSRPSLVANVASVQLESQLVYSEFFS